MAAVECQLVLLALAVFIGLSTGALNNQCEKYSPEEMWYADISPLLNDSIEELRIYYRIIFDRMEDGNLFNFMPEIKQDPEKVANWTERLYVVRQTSWALVLRAQQVIEESWLNLGEAGRRFSDGKTSTQELVESMEALSRAHVNGNTLLVASIRGIAAFFKELIELALEGVTQMLEQDLAPEKEADAPVMEGKELVQLIHDKIGQIASGDFLGTIVRRFLGRGLGTIHSRPAREEEKEPILREILPRVDQLVTDLKGYMKFQEMLGREPLTADSWTGFWEQVFEQSLVVTNKRAEQGPEDLEHIYSNEVYVAEVTMNIVVLY